MLPVRVLGRLSVVTVAQGSSWSIHPDWMLQPDDGLQTSLCENLTRSCSQRLNILLTAYGWNPSSRYFLTLLRLVRTSDIVTMHVCTKIQMKGKQAVWVSPLMLHEAWSCYTVGFKWKYACASRWPVNAENQLCFFASISFTVCHLSHGLLHSACLNARQPVLMSCN